MIINYYRSPFIKQYSFNSLSLKFREQLVQMYKYGLDNDLSLTSGEYIFNFGKQTNLLTDITHISNDIWVNYYNKVFLTYLKEQPDVTFYTSSIEVQTRLWYIDKNIRPLYWIKASIDLSNSFISITNLNNNNDIKVKFKNYQSFKLRPGCTLIFPATFEYSYAIEIKEPSYIVFCSINKMFNS